LNFYALKNLNTMSVTVFWHWWFFKKTHKFLLYNILTEILLYCLLQNTSIWGRKGLLDFPHFVLSRLPSQILENFPQGISACSMHEACYCFSNVYYIWLRCAMVAKSLKNYNLRVNIGLWKGCLECSKHKVVGPQFLHHERSHF